MGAQVKLSIQGSGQFDLAAKRLVALEWLQKDERDQGPASPASTLQTTSKLTRRLCEPVDALSDVALVSVPDGPGVPAALTLLTYHEPKGRFDLAYNRAWQLVGQADEHHVFRLLDRGDFVAQVSIASWPKAEPGKHATPQEFQEAMARTPGWEQQEVLQAEEVPAQGGRWVYRYSSAGVMNNLKVVQYAYLVAGPQGDQVQLAFMMTQKQVEKLATRDLELVNGISFPGQQKAPSGP
jgi:hypothetical protein